MHLVTGPFKMLEGEWLLTPIPQAVHGGAGCRVQLTMKFAFKNALTAVLFEQKFAETASSLMDAFVARARALPP
jgi:ribosome-associated toxin RatA of RatAB toxin-antitoxin module